MIEIRQASSADLPAVVDVIHAAFDEYRGRLDPPSSAHHKTVESAREELRDGGAFVAVDGSELVGCVFYHPYPDHIYLDRLAVLPAQRGRGLARRLISAVEQRALAAAIPLVRLSVRLALADNRAYYERQGYQLWRFGTHAGYAAPTYVTLQKRIERQPVEARYEAR
jgi:predicted N-acetyltransferase YhbS